MTSFFPFELDTERRELRKNGGQIALPPKAFDVLAYLVRHRDRVVTKSELLDAFWTQAVSEAALQKTLSLIRKAIAVDGAPPLIKTHHGLGFRFVGDVTGQPVPAAADRPDIALREQRLVAVLALRFDPDNSQEILKSARQLVSESGGALLRMQTQGFVAEFGLRSACDDAARRAVQCSVALHRTTKPVTCAISAGVVEYFEDDEQALWALPSPVERTAQEMVEQAEPGQILISPEIQHQLGTEITTRLGNAGIEVIALDHAKSGIPGRPLKHPAPFVGRSAEMAFLLQQNDGLSEAGGQAVVLTGPAGIGKTRLIAEFLQGLDSQARKVILLNCLSSLEHSPLSIIRDLCHALLAETKVPITTDLERALVAELQGDPADPILATLSDHQRRQLRQALLLRLLRAVCAQMPVVLVIEDAHWLDATSRDDFDFLVRQVASLPVLIVGTTRPVEAPPLADSGLTLSPLGPRDSLVLLKETAKDLGIDADIAHALIDRAAGNPFFIEELALAAQSGKDPLRDLPDTVQSVVSVRISALSPALREVLYAAAVVGSPAPTEIVQTLLGISQDAIRGVLAQLCDMGFVYAQSERVAFRHILIRDAAYAMLTTEDRKRLHADVAAYLDQLQTARPESRAWHHQEAGHADIAMGLWKDACRAALQQGSAQETIVFAQNGMALIDPSKSDAAKAELGFQLYLAPALTTLKGYGAPEVGQAYQHARDLSAQAGDAKTEIRAVVGLWIHSWVSGNLALALKRGETLLAFARQVQDPALTLQAHASMGQVLMHKGALQDALAHLNTGLASLEHAAPSTIPAQNSAVACAAYASWTHSLRGDCEQTLRLYETSRDLSRVFENPFAEAIHNGLCAEPFFFLGDVDRCLACASHAVDISRDHGFVFWLGTGLVLRGWALSQQGQLDDAFEATQEGIEMFEGAGAGVQLANWYGLKAEVELAAGRYAAGLKTAQHALTCAEVAEDRYFSPRIHATIARLQSALGDDAAAKNHHAFATQLAHGFGMSDRIL